MMLLYAAEKQTYFGFIPNDQNGFIEKLKEVMAKQKQFLTMQQRMVSRMEDVMTGLIYCVMQMSFEGVSLYSKWYPDRYVSCFVVPRESLSGDGRWVQL